MTKIIYDRTEYESGGRSYKYLELKKDDIVKGQYTISNMRISVAKDGKKTGCGAAFSFNKGEGEMIAELIRGIK